MDCTYECISDIFLVESIDVLEEVYVIRGKGGDASEACKET